MNGNDSWASEEAPKKSSTKQYNIFFCPVCKKWKNSNRERKVMGWHTWKSMPVCNLCFKECGLEC